MGYTVTGYLLTPDQVCLWCRKHGIFGSDSDAFHLIPRINSWLSSHGHSPRVMQVQRSGDTLYLVLTGAKVVQHASTRHLPLHESASARYIRDQMDLGSVEFVTIHV